MKRRRGAPDQGQLWKTTLWQPWVHMGHFKIAVSGSGARRRSASGKVKRKHSFMHPTSMPAVAMLLVCRLFWSAIQS